MGFYTNNLIQLFLIFYKMKNLLMKWTQAMITTPWHGFILKYKDIFVAFFEYGIILKPIPNNILGDKNIVFVVPLIDRRGM